MDSADFFRQHLTRRHMMSSRCTRCWACFEKKTALEEHQRDARCAQMDKPADECFMDAETETLMKQKARDTRSDRTSPEASWWSLFKMLIPGVQETEIDELKEQYDPCELASQLLGYPLTKADYKRNTQVLMTPAFMFPEWCMPAPDADSTDVDMTAMWDQPMASFTQAPIGNEPASSVHMPTLFSTVSQDNLSRSLSVPVFAVDASLTGVAFPPAPDPPMPLIDTTDAAMDDLFLGTFDAASSAVHTSTATVSTPTSSACQPASSLRAINTATPTSSTGPTAVQLQRDYDILKLRHEQAAEQHTRFVLGANAAGADVERAEAILHEVMEMPEVQGPLYERLLMMAGYLMKATGHLR